MKSSIYLFLGICAFAHPPLVQAAAGWTDYVKIAELVATSRHYYEVRLPTRKNPSGCSDTNWFYQDYGIKGSEKMFTAILEGLQSGNRVRLYVTGKCNLDGYSEFSAVGIIP